MIGLDTNILVRIIVRDDLKQAGQAMQAITEAKRHGCEVFISHIVLCELFWVLGSRFRYGKEQIITALDNVIFSEDFTIEDEDLICEVFERYQKSNADFADILIALRNQQAGCKHTLTFDAKAVKAKGFKKAG